MKKTLIAALLALGASAAHAGIISYMQNVNGGLIEFTDTACSASGPKVISRAGWVAFTTLADGTVTYTGCWEAMEPNVMVLWSDGTFRAYQDVVTFTDYGRRVMQRGK
jgi:hypothetical protein